MNQNNLKSSSYRIEVQCDFALCNIVFGEFLVNVMELLAALGNFRFTAGKRWILVHWKNVFMRSVKLCALEKFSKNIFHQIGKVHRTVK